MLYFRSSHTVCIELTPTDEELIEAQFNATTARLINHHRTTMGLLDRLFITVIFCTFIAVGIGVMMHGGETSPSMDLPYEVSE